MPTPNFPERLASMFAKPLAFANDHRGVSAVEFAILAPLMVTLYLGGVEVSDAVAASRKTTIVARTVADLVAQDSKLTNAGKDEVLSAAKFVGTPYANANLGITVSSIKIDNAGIAKVEWSDTKDGKALTVGSTVTLDAALAVPNTWLILGEATYKYKPTFGEGITGPINLYDKIYMRPRISPNVQRTAS
jgi:Flp pilus assembly protein TadG